VPEAITTPVVSMVPPSQAPVTVSESPINLARKGMKIIIGMAVRYTNRSSEPILTKFSAVNTLSTKSKLLSQPNDGEGILKPNKAKRIIRKPKATTVQSSVNNAFSLLGLND
jgi:hypothetical protein